MARRGLSEPEQGHRRPARVRDHYTVDRTVVVKRGADGGLPVNCVGAGVRLNAREVRVLDVDQEAGPVAEVAEEHVADDLRGALAPGFEGFGVGAELEDEAILAVDPVLADAPRSREHVCCGQGVQALVEQLAADYSKWIFFFSRVKYIKKNHKYVDLA